jgi:hypothetical protein
MLAPVLTAALAERQARGEAMSNPAYSDVVGSLGLWLPDDSQTATGGRHLIPEPLPPPGQPLLAAPAAAEFHAAQRMLSLDLSNTVPEVDATLTKADLGRITVAATQDGTTVELATIESGGYITEAYEARSGIVDLPITGAPDEAAELVRNGRLELGIGTAASVAQRPLIAQERELVAICDDAGIYLEDGETRTVPVRVRERGGPPTTPLTLVVAAYGGPGDPDVHDPIPVPADGPVGLPVGASGRVLEHLSMTVTAEAAAEPVPSALPLGTAQFVTVRTLPGDEDLAAVPDSDLTWDLLFTEVLSHYHAVTPRMSTIIDLSDRDAVQTFAARILEVTNLDANRDRNPPPFESARCMPVTRDMSANRRQLLRRYCAKLLGEPLPGPVLPGRRRPSVRTRMDGARAVAGLADDAASVEPSFPKTARS